MEPPDTAISRYMKNANRTEGIIYTVGGTLGLITLIIVSILEAL